MRHWQLDSLAVEPHHPEVLHSDDGANRVIFLVLPEGERLQEHQVHEHALVLVLDGELHVSAGDQERSVSAPGLLHFDVAERHEVSAVSDCRLLICLAPWPGPGHPNLTSAQAS
jgi:quercetin dioxygenase-like cupin family protein